MILVQILLLVSAILVDGGSTFRGKAADRQVRWHVRAVCTEPWGGGSDGSSLEVGVILPSP